MKHYCVDTNVIIDMLANRGEFAEAASNLMDAAGRGEICVYISSLIIFEYILHYSTIFGARENDRKFERIV